MSILETIIQHVNAGLLFELLPTFAGDPHERTMFISPEIKAYLTGPWMDEYAERRTGRMKADLEQFVVGDTLGVSLTPYEAKSAYMGLLDPPRNGIFDVRCQDPSPGLRIFGGFAQKDVFVALTCHARSRKVNFIPRPPLGAGRSAEFSIAIQECIQIWRGLFGADLPLTGGTLSDFLSSKAFLV